jgi:DNA-binding transcriptional LysR family regulator
VPSIRTFRTFLSVVKHGTFAAAGAEIGLTAAAVGLQIRALETDLHQSLFDRGARSITLNATGRRVAMQVEDLVSRYEALSAAEDGDELSGTVVVGALVSALMGAFADALWSLKLAHPRLEVKLFAGLSSDFARRIERSELDAAVVTRPPYALPSSLIWTSLYTEPMVLIAPRRPHFVTPRATLDLLRSAPFIRFDRQTWTGYLVNDALKQCSATVKDAMELNSVEAIIETVRQGFGISIVPRLANVRWTGDRSLKIIPLPCCTVKRHVGLLERTQHSRLRFTDAIKSYFELSKKSRG